MEHAKSLTLYKHNYKHSSIFNNFHLTMMLWHIETLYLFNKLYSKTPMQLCINCQWESGLSLQILFLIFFCSSFRKCPWGPTQESPDPFRRHLIL